MAVSGHLLYWTTGLNSCMPDKFRHECAGADTRDGTQPPCNFETAFFKVTNFIHSPGST